MRDKRFIKSFAKGLGLLELLGSSSEPLTLTQIATELGHTKTTAQRFLYTLTSLGYVKRVEGKRYVLGSKILRLSFQLLQKDNFYKQAQTSLEELSDRIDKSVTLGVLEETEVLVIYRKERTRYFPYAIYSGSRLPMHCSATGKVLLASMPDDELADMLDRIELNLVTPKTITSKKGLLSEIQGIRKRGYSNSDQEFSLDLYSIGIPLLDGRGKVVAAAALSLATGDKNNKKLVKESMDAFFETGLKISQGLGYEGPYPQINW